MTTFADLNRASESFNNTGFPFFLNLIFLNLNIFVLLLSSWEEVCKYSHDRIAKNNANIRRWDTALSHGLYHSSNIFLNTEAGKAFCFFLFLSRFLYPLNCSWSKKHVLPSMPNLGSLLEFALKACDTYDTVVSTVPATRDSLWLLEKVASLTAWAKANMMIFCWNLDYLHPSICWFQIFFSYKNLLMGVSSP